MFDTRLNSESHFFVKGQEISGLDTLDVGYSNSTAVLNPLGYAKGVTAVGGATFQQVSFSRNLIYADPILDYTGTESISGSVNYNGGSYGFTSGYLTSYSVNCAVNSIPQVNTSVVVYDEMRSGYNASGSASPPTIYIPSQGSITATCDNTTTNRVVGFDYSLTVKRKPYYTIGSEFPSDVSMILPIEYSASVQLEVDDAFLESGYAFLGTGKSNKTVSFSIAGRDGTSLQSLSIPNACLVGEKLNSSADGALRLTLNYMGHDG